METGLLFRAHIIQTCCVHSVFLLTGGAVDHCSNTALTKNSGLELHCRRHIIQHNVNTASGDKSHTCFALAFTCNYRASLKQTVTGNDISLFDLKDITSRFN